MGTIAGAALFAVVAAAVFGQSTPTSATQTGAGAGSAASVDTKVPVKFEIADVHASPPRRFPFFDGAFLEDGRYILRQATIADLITTAYGLKDSSYVQGGPSWLEWDRWDVTAKVPPGTSEATAKEMLQSLLKERFNLVIHSGNGAVPSYLLTLEREKPDSNLKASTGTEDSACKGEPRPASPPPPGTIMPALIHCHNMTMAKFAEQLPGFAGAYLQKPAVDKTGLTGAYDFDLRWTSRIDLPRAGSDGISVFDALDKELGLKLALGTADGTVFIVDSVNETPKPNAADLAKIMPPLPPAQFEVAVVKPSAPDEKPAFRITKDGVSFHALPLKVVIDFAWDLNFNEETVGAPKWLDSDKVDIDAKVSTENMIQGGPVQGTPPISIEELREMLKALVIDRFEIKTHVQDIPEDAYTLVAVDPKMTKADPKERTQCKEGPGPDGKDPRTTHAILNMLVSCQNVTMEQAAKLFPTFAAWYVRYPIEEKTGLKGGWDFTLSWSSGNFMPNFSGPGAAPNSQGETASDPNGAVSFYDAVSKELGLKLVKGKRPEQVVVFDHIDEQPTAN